MLTKNSGFAEPLLGDPEIRTIKQYTTNKTKSYEQKTITTDYDLCEMGDSEIATHNVVFRLIYDKWFLLTYVAVCIITIALFWWEIGNHGWLDNGPLPIWFVVLDWSVIVLQTFSVLLNVLSTPVGERYLGSLLNIFDIVVLSVCLISQILYFSLISDFRRETWANSIMI